MNFILVYRNLPKSTNIVPSCNPRSVDVGTVYLTILMLLVSLVTPGYTFYHRFFSEQYVNFIPGATLGKGKLRINLQHNFNDYKIASSNFRLGYGFTPTFDVNLAAIYHSLRISSGQDTANLEVKELEVVHLKSLFPEVESTGWNLNFAFGVNKLWFTQKFINTEFADNKTYYFTYLGITGLYKNMLRVDFAPTYLYEIKGNYLIGFATGIKFNLQEKVALLFELPVLITNPFKWQQTWSVGLQFHTRPHIWTVFVTNTYGFTMGNLFQGLEIPFFGFRYSF